jgi:hypothetical protein
MNINNKFSVGDIVKVMNTDYEHTTTGVIDYLMVDAWDVRYHVVGVGIFPACNLELAEPPTEKRICSKCGKVTEYRVDEFDSKINRVWSIDLGRAGYGSSFDGCDVRFQLCDDCLTKLIMSFPMTSQVKIWNSGSNAYGTDEEWLAGIRWGESK